MTSSTPLGWMHDAVHIRRLQHAHADHIESIYTGLSHIAGNPDNVRIQSFGETRTFLANGERFTNRIILSGNETATELDILLAYYDMHHAGCVIEVNPANFYPSNPFSWDSAVVPLLFARGCELRHFRCVWYRSCLSTQKDTETLDTIHTVDPTQLDRYIAFAHHVDPERDWNEQHIERLKAEAQDGWYYYVAFDNGTPIALASLYTTHELGYLADTYTHPDHRRHGAHTRLIQRRIQHARQLGCQGVFSVTDSHTQSARDLQRMGFLLAYNYLLFVRSPLLTIQ